MDWEDAAQSDLLDVLEELLEADAHAVHLEFAAIASTVVRTVIAHGVKRLIHAKRIRLAPQARHLIRQPDAHAMPTRIARVATLMDAIGAPLDNALLKEPAVAPS